MKLTPFDVKGEFERLCGPDVAYESHNIANHTLTVYFTIEGVQRHIRQHLRNGTSPILCYATRICARVAADQAYVSTGKRGLDMAQLLKGRLVDGGR